MLLLLGVALTANYFGMNFPAPVTPEEKESVNIDETEFRIFNIVHTIVCIFTSLLAGILCDVIGVRKCYLIFTSLSLLGQLMCLLAIYISKDEFVVGLFGRLILGLGAEA